MKIMRNASLRPYSYYRTGGAADFLFLPETIEDACRAMRDIHELQIPFFILGGGSNSLVSDEYWEGAVVCLNSMRKIESRARQRLYVEAGAENTAVAKFALDQNLAGIAWMNRLPGQLGGTVRMNARCYGGEISQVVDKVWVVTPQGELHVMQSPEPMFTGYKDTVFMKNRNLIVAVEIQLQQGVREDIQKLMDFCEEDRIKKGQFLHPSCGCVFKNNYQVGIPSGKLLEAAGVKNLKTKHLSINPHHANFLFNEEGLASSQEILDLSFVMQNMVYKHAGVWLEYEMEVLGRVDEQRQLRLKLGAAAK